MVLKDETRQQIRQGMRLVEGWVDRKLEPVINESMTHRSSQWSLKPGTKLIFDVDDGTDSILGTYTFELANVVYDNEDTPIYNWRTEFVPRVVVSNKEG